MNGISLAKILMNLCEVFCDEKRADDVLKSMGSDSIYFLVAKGFYKLKENTSASVSASYIGKNECFIVSYDIRGKEASMTIAKIRNEKT